MAAMNRTRLTREDAVERLVASEREIRALGVQRLALFGSVLRGEARPDSDVDLLVQFSPGAKTFERFLALFDLLEERLGHRVEIVTTEALSPFIGPRILAEAQDVLRAARLPPPHVGGGRLPDGPSGRPDARGIRGQRDAS